MTIDHLHCPMSYAVYKFQPEMGEFAACCDSNAYQFDSELFDLLGHDYFEYHPSLVERKQALYNNIKHKDCEQCWIKEAQGLTSMRTGQASSYIEAFENDISFTQSRVARIELWMNSTCNLGCFMCHQGNSNTLRKIWRNDKDSYGNDGIGFEQYMNNGSYAQQGYHSQFVESMLQFTTKQIRDLTQSHLNIAYLGGEPTLHHEMYDHADRFIEAGREAIAHGKELKIEITTNGTSKDKLNERFYRMYEKYKEAGWKTRVMLSQDGANESAQVRHGADFKQIAHNFGNWIKPDSVVDEVVSFTVVSALNLPAVDQMADYINNTVRSNSDGNKRIAVHFNTLISPEWMRVGNLPRKYADQSIEHARRIFEQLADDYPNIDYNSSLFENITDSLPSRLSVEQAQDFFERIDYTNTVYQKSYPDWDFYQQFPFLAEYKNEYGIE